MDIFELSEIVAGGNEAVTAYLQSHGMLRTAGQCQPCGRPFTQIRKAGSTTGFVFRCPACRRKGSLSAGSMFAGSHLPVKKHITLLYFWSCGTSVTQTTHQCTTSAYHLPPSSNGISTSGTFVPRSYCKHLLYWAALSTCGVNATAARRRWRSLTCSVTSQNDIRCSDITAIKLPPTTGPFQDHPHFTEETHVRDGCMCTFIVVCIMRIFIAFAVFLYFFAAYVVFSRCHSAVSFILSIHLQ